MTNVTPTGQNNTDSRTVYVTPIQPGSPLNEQIGGDHYKSMPIQPIEYIRANNLGFEEGNAIKYITRHRYKGGVQDLRKAIHYLELLIEYEEIKKQSVAGQ